MVQLFKEITKKLFKLCLTPRKTINGPQSFSFQVNEIIIDYLFKVSKNNVKTMFSCDINRSILSDKTFQDYSFVIHWLFHLFTKICSHANWKSTDKWSPTCFKSLLKISHLSFWLFINKTLRLNKLKTRTTMDEKTRVFAICFEAIMYLLLNSLHDCTFNLSFTNVRTKLYNLRISPAQNEYTNNKITQLSTLIQSSSNVIDLLFKYS